MPRFLVVIERTENNYSAYLPDLPGCIATGRTLDEVRQAMREAIALHIQGMIEDHLPLPEPRATADYVAISA